MAMELASWLATDWRRPRLATTRIVLANLAHGGTAGRAGALALCAQRHREPSPYRKSPLSRERIANISPKQHVGITLDQPKQYNRRKQVIITSTGALYGRLALSILEGFGSQRADSLEDDDNGKLETP